jgi:Transmembrane domain of unknown function (DUF3566)
MGGNVPEEDGVDHRVEPKLWLTDGSDEGTPSGSEPAQTAPAERADAPGEADPLVADLPPLPSNGDAALPGDSNSHTMPGQDMSYPGQDVPYTGQQIAYDPSESATAAHEVPYSPAEVPYSAAPTPYGAADQETESASDGLRIPPYQPQVPPPPPPAPAPVASQGQPTQVPPYPAQVPPAPMPGVAAKVTAPFAALAKPKVKAKKPPRSAKPARPRVGAAATGAATATAARPPVAERVASKTGSVPRGAAPTRRAQLVLSRVEPWSVMKFSFMVSLVGWVILFVAVAALYYVLSKLGVFHSIQSTITQVTSSKGSSGADASGQWFSASRILGYTMLVGAINVVLITALATVGAVIYNLVTHLAGGIEVTLKETD